MNENDNDVYLDMSSYVFPNSENEISLKLFEPNRIKREKLEKTKTHIHWPANVKRILKDGFINFYSLKEIVIPESVEYIGDNAFRYCEKLESIEFEGNQPNIKEIGQKAFYNAGFLAENQIPYIYIPDSCTTIKYSSFYNVNTSIFSIPKIDVIKEDPISSEFIISTSTDRLFIFIRQQVHYKDAKDILIDNLKKILFWTPERKSTFFFNIQDDSTNNKLKTAVLDYDENDELPYNLNNFNFSGINLSQINIYNQNFKGREFNNSIISANTFKSVKFENCHFINTLFEPNETNEKYENLIFENCDFENANMHNVVFSLCQFKRTQEDRKQTKFHYFNKTIMTNTDFSNNCIIEDNMINQTKKSSHFKLLDCKLESLPDNVINYYYSSYVDESKHYLNKNVFNIVTDYIPKFKKIIKKIKPKINELETIKKTRDRKKLNEENNNNKKQKTDHYVSLRPTGFFF